MGVLPDAPSGAGSRPGFATRPNLVDAGLILLLGLVASYGFKDTFNGWTFLVAAGAGFMIGILLAHLSSLLGRPVVVLAVLVVAAFFLFGGAVALHADGVLASLPLPGTLAELADQAVHGWKDLLTTRAPIDGGPLLTLPYLMGLVAGSGGMALASRTRSAMWPLLAPVTYLAAVILLGIQQPDRLITLGIVFAVLAIIWIAMRSGRLNRRLVKGGPSWRRRGVGALLIAAAAASAPVVGPQLPGADTRERTVLRAHITPPFDIGQYPSPLAGFRRYTKGYRVAEGSEDSKLYDRELLRVDDLPAGSRLRFAALDEYSGSTWGASNQAPDVNGPDGQFQRVGTAIRDDGPGIEVTATVTLADDYDGVWVPTTGSVDELEFTGPDADDEAKGFRYNLATDTGVLPQGLRGGDSYTFTARVPDEDDRLSSSTTPSGQSLSTDAGGVDFRPVAQRWGGDGTGIAQLLAMARHMDSEGYYTDGGAEGEAFYNAGHSLKRLSEFTAADGTQTAGNDEQYAATLALLGTQIGLPIRVVMGAVVPEGGVVKGKDVHAWVEVKDSAGVWRELPYDQFLPPYDKPPNQSPPSEQELKAGTIIPPPAPVRPPASAGDPLATDDNRRGNQEDGGWFSLPAWLVTVLKYVGAPLLALALLFGGVVGAKSLRRKRRRTRGAPGARLVAAWREALDQARDVGHLVHGRRTRREQAAQIGLPSAAVLARSADRHVFGSTAPSDDDALAFWSQVDGLRVELVAGLSRWQRFRAAISPTSFRRLPSPGPEVGA
jgi:hypothetical protein